MPRKPLKPSKQARNNQEREQHLAKQSTVFQQELQRKLAQQQSKAA